MTNAILCTVLVMWILLVPSCMIGRFESPGAELVSLRQNKLFQPRGDYKIIPITYPQIREWILDESCVTICWQGITLGQTTVGEAAAIVETLPFARAVEVAKDEYSIPYWIEVSVWLQMVDGTTEAKWISLTAEQERADGLFVDTIEFPYSANEISLGDLMQVYGTPTHVRVSAEESSEGPYWIVALLWIRENRGLDAIMMVDNPGITIDRNLYVSGGFRLRVPSPADLQREWDGFVPWQGEHTAEFYAAQLEH